MAGDDNALPAPEVESFFEKFKDNFDDPLIRILCIALVIIFVLAFLGYADFIEGAGIAVSILIATFVATYSEYKNENSFRVLQDKASKIKTLCLRGPDGQTPKSVPIDFLTHGDVVVLQGGDRVPADGVVIHGTLVVNQSSLNGESEGIDKTAGPDYYAATDAKNRRGRSRVEDDDLLSPTRVFRGSVVNEGQALIRIDRLGKETVFGKVAAVLSVSDKRKQPLKMRLEALAETIAKLSYAGAVLIALSFAFKQFLIDNHFVWSEVTAYASNVGVVVHDMVTAAMLAIIVVVCAVPEGLPTMIAVVLSLNMQRLLSQKVLVRQLLGIETAGCLEVLFTDKTGTITEGSFTPSCFVDAGLTRYEALMQMPSALQLAVQAAIEGSSATVARRNEHGKIEYFGGNPTDRSIAMFLYKSPETHAGGVRDSKRDDCALSRACLPDEIPARKETELGVLKRKPSPEHGSRFELLQEIRFSSATKFSARRVRFRQNAFEISRLKNIDVFSQFADSKARGASDDVDVSIVRGAAELIVDKSITFLDASGRIRKADAYFHGRLKARINQMSSDGGRVIAIALSSARLDVEGRTIPEGLTLLGFISLRDRVRVDSAECVQMCHDAGIQVVMVTGDKLETAVAVARATGLLRKYSSRNAVLSSADLNRMSDDELAETLPRLAVVARALPSDKVRLVRVARGSGGGPGHVVGMTGDGINDAPALKSADVSFAMGDGAEVAKEASDIVILDNRLRSIISSVLYGRTIFKTIRKFVTFQSTINLASTLIVFVGPFMGFDFPLTLIQLLWVNLVMDTFAALAFGGEPADPNFLNEPPLPRDQPIVSLAMMRSIVCNGLYTAACSVAFLTWDPILELFDRGISEALAPIDHDDLKYKDVAKVEDFHEMRAQGGPVFLTAFFCFFIFMCTFNALNVRTPSLNLFDKILENPGFVIVIGTIFFLQFLFCQIGGHILRTVPLSAGEWASLLAMTSTVIPFDMCRKFLFERRGVIRASGARVARDELRDFAHDDDPEVGLLSGNGKID